MNRPAGTPYIGLRRFEAEDSHLFFGREREVLTVIERLRERRFIMVTGESGCGKSSLIRAGVIPSLHRGAMTGTVSAWRIAMMLPGGRPITNLARALAQAFAEESKEATELYRDSILIETVLRSGSRGLIEVARQWRPREETTVVVGGSVRAAADSRAADVAMRGRRASNVLVLVDQFEEIFRFKGDSRTGDSGEEARAFVTLLLTAAAERSGGTYCALTMRSDFLGECAQFAGLPEAVNRGECLLSRMTRDELRLAITGPAAVAGLQISPLLVTEVVNDMGDQPGRLPVLQHALMRACQERDRDHEGDEPVSSRHFGAVGGLEHALSNHANETFEQLDEPGRRLAEKVFRALTEVDLGGRPIRRPTSFGSICAACAASPSQAARIILHFAAAGRNFLSVEGSGPELQPEAMVDLTHESLISQWDRLGEWMRQEYRDADLYRSLARDAALHARNEKGYWRDPELALGRQWRATRQPNPEWAGRYAPGFSAALQYLQDSEAAWRRDRMIRWGLIWSVALLMTVAAGAVALWQKARSDALQDEKTRLEKQIEDLTARNPELGVEAQRLRDENRELQWKILQLRTASDRLNEEISRLRRAGDDLRAEAARLERRIADLDSRIRSLEQVVTALQSQRSDLEKQRKDLARRATDLHAANRELRIAALAAGMLPPEITSRLSAMAMPRPVTASASRDQLSSQQVAPPASDMLLERLRFELDQALAENLLLKKTIQELQEQKRRLRQQESKEQARNAALTADRDRLRKESEELQAQVQISNDRIAEREGKLARLRDQHQLLADQVNALGRSVNGLKDEIATLGRENEAIKGAIGKRRGAAGP